MAVFYGIGGSEADKVNKHFLKPFKNKGLDIAIQCNKVIAVNYLHVTLNLNSGTFSSYKKDNNEKITYKKN